MFTIISILTASFMPFIIISILLFVHEIGHFLSAYLLGINVYKIYFYPYGGESRFNMDLNESILKEFIILIMGPVAQCIIYFILIKTSFFNNYIYIIKNIHYSILIFNLLPIYPLDGGRLLNLLFNIKFSFKRSILLSIYFSYIMIFILIMIEFPNILKINILLIILLLLYKVTLEYKKKDYYVEKFLLERYIKNFNFRKIKEVKNIEDFMKGYRHYIKNNEHYYTEKDILSKKFKT